MREREYNEEWYRRLEVEGDDVKNADICNQIADESCMWNSGEAVYWRKKAVEKIENHYGKENIINTVYYDKLVDDFLQKGSFQQALKWNKKSKSLKIKEKGEYAFEIITNDLYELEAAWHTSKWDIVVISLENIKEWIKKNPECDSAKLYEIYFEAAFVEGLDSLKEIRPNDGYFVDHAIELANEIYGKDSLEELQACRRKAVGIMKLCQGEEENRESLELMKKTMLRALEKGDDGKQIVRTIFEEVKDCWPNDVCVQEGVKWLKNNIPERYIEYIIMLYLGSMQREMRDALNACTLHES